MSNWSSSAVDDINKKLLKAYVEKLYPFEKLYKFHEFHGPELSLQDFQVKPLVLLIGQYSTGKTSLINSLLGQNYCGSKIGPEPSTQWLVYQQARI